MSEPVAEQVERGLWEQPDGSANISRKVGDHYELADANYLNDLEQTMAGLRTRLGAAERERDAIQHKEIAAAQAEFAAMRDESQRQYARAEVAEQRLAVVEAKAALQINELSQIIADYYNRVGRAAVDSQRLTTALETAFRQTHGLHHTYFKEDGEPLTYEECTLYVCKSNRRTLAALNALHPTELDALHKEVTP